MNRTRILSIDGGDIKVIVPSLVLLHLEKLLQDLSYNPALSAYAKFRYHNSQLHEKIL
jgi:hypothetical protein